MSKRWLLNIALALAVAGLVVFALYGPRPSTTPPTTPLTTLKPDQISTVRLTRPNRPEIVLEKSNDQWRMISPRMARANEFRIGDLLGLVATPVATRIMAAPEQLAKFGLDHPIAMLTLNDETIQLGAMHPIHNQVYVLYRSQVCLLPSSVLRAATVQVENLFSPRPLDEKSRVSSMHFPEFSLKQGESGAWVRTPSIPDLASDDVNRFVDEWSNASALSVSTMTAKAPRERIRIKLLADGQSKVVEFAIVRRKPEVVLLRMDEHLAYHFPEDTGTRLLNLRPETLNQTTDGPARTPARR